MPVVVLVVAALLAGGSSGAAGPPGVGKVDAGLLDQVSTGEPGRFYVLLDSQAETAGAETLRGHAERVGHVYRAKKAHAERTQAGLRRMLAERKVAATPFWIANAIGVTGGRHVLLDIAARPEVARIVPEPAYRLVRPARKEPGRAAAGGVEWNVDRVGAPRAWQAYGASGEGIVVGTIDTGAAAGHPAIARQYRGAASGSAPRHDYNWFDPSRICGEPTTGPCDNVGHGTHVLGTILGDDRKGNRIGVAPGANWIAAKGCEADYCSADALLAAGEWMMAPRDLTGNNPRPDLAPHIVNNSWSGPTGGDPFFEPIVRTWVQAGILPVFANGNSGPGCGTALSPGDVPGSYAVGAFDRDNTIASFSGRGPGGFGDQAKPDLAAPGVRVRSSVPGDRYEEWDGTSMAAPHVSGTAALVWSAVPAVRGDLAASRKLLDDTATPVDDQSCGGTAGANNVWGHGRLDAFTALAQAPAGAVGTLAGAVRSGIEPLGGVPVRVEGPVSRTVQTGKDGGYTLPTLPVGEYGVTVRGYGYRTATARVTIEKDSTTARDFDLPLAPRRLLSGQVRDEAGRAVAGADVGLPGTPAPTVRTDEQGRYRLPDIPEGDYDLRADHGRCLQPRQQPVTVAGDTVADLTLPAKSDVYGHVCGEREPAWHDTGTVLPLQGDENTAGVTLPFPVNLYHKAYRNVHVNTNGYLSFTTGVSHSFNQPIPGNQDPNAAVYAFWDDLNVDAKASVRTGTVGTAPHREFVVEWRDVAFVGKPADVRTSFQVVLHEDGRITMRYRGAGADPVQAGASATIGIENELGTDGIEYSADRPVLTGPTTIELRVPDTGLVRGTVTDANDGKPVSGAEIVAEHQDAPPETVQSDDAGVYQVRVRAGDLRLSIGKRDYVTEFDDLRIAREGHVVVRDAALRTARLEAEPTGLDLVVPAGETRSRTVTITNTGSAPLTWRAEEAGGGAARASGGAPPRRLAGFDPDARTSKGVQQAARPAAPPVERPTVLRSWPTAGLQLGWGVGYQAGVWVSDAYGKANRKYGVDGSPGKTVPATWSGDWPADLAYVPGRGLVCQLAVGGDNGIHCWDPETGEVRERIAGAFPWTNVSQRGLAYRADDDSFYVGGWNEGVVYHVRGLSHPDRGTVIGQCRASDPNISGLAYNNAFGMLWSATNGQDDRIHGMNPDTCETLKTFAPPDSVAYTGAGLETDPVGNLWVMSQGNPSTAYLLESGVPDFGDVPWLRASPSGGTLEPGQSGQVRLDVDTTGLAPGVYGASAVLVGNSGRGAVTVLPVRLVVPAYQAGINAGGDAYQEALGDSWQADRPYVKGGYGYLGQGSWPVQTDRPIAGARDQRLYQRQRMGAYEYRFDNVPDGTYAIELKFAELWPAQPNARLFDVISEDQLLLPALDVAGTAGHLTALDRTFHVKVTDGQLNVRLISRKGDPIVNAIRVTERPDRKG